MNIIIVGKCESKSTVIIQYSLQYFPDGFPYVIVRAFSTPTFSAPPRWSKCMQKYSNRNRYKYKYIKAIIVKVTACVESAFCIQSTARMTSVCPSLRLPRNWHRHITGTVGVLASYTYLHVKDDPESNILCSWFPLRNTSGVWKMCSCALWAACALRLACRYLMCWASCLLIT